MATVLPVRDSLGDAIADPNFPSRDSGARPARPAHGVRPACKDVGFSRGSLSWRSEVWAPVSLLRLSGIWGRTAWLSSHQRMRL